MDPTASPSVLDQVTASQPKAVVINSAPTYGANGQPVSAAPVAKQPSWWEKLLPAVGGVLGGIVGIPGDLFSGGISSVAGATGGAALGQALENKLTGKSALEMNDLTSGVENGIGDVVGLGAGKVVGALGSGIIKAGSKVGDKAAEAAAQDATRSAALTDQKATELNYGGISDPMQKALKLGDSQDFVNSMGFDGTDPRDMQRVSAAGQYLNNVYDRALSNSKPVDMSDAGKLLGVQEGTATAGLTPEEQAAASKMGVTPEMMAKGTVQGGDGVNPSTVYEGLDRNSPVGQALGEYNRSIGAAPNASLPTEMNATEVRKLQQAVGHQIGNLQKTVNAAQLSGKYDADLIGQLQDLNELYGKLGAKIKTPEVNDSIAKLVVTPADRQGLVAEYGDKLGNHIADTVSNAQTADDLLGPMQHFKRMGDTSDMALEDITQARATPRASKRVEFQHNGGVAPSSKTVSNRALGDTVETAAKALHSPTGLVIAAGRKMHEAGLTPKVAEKVGTVLTKAGGPAFTRVAENSVASPLSVASTAYANAPNIAAASNSAIPLANGTASNIPVSPNGGAMNPTINPGNPIPSSVDTTLSALERPGATLTPGYGGMVSLLDTLAPQAVKQQLAHDVVGNMAPTFANAGGAQGFGSGLLNTIIGHMVPGSSQATYLREHQAAAAQLAAILGIPLQQAMALLPSMMNSAPVAGQQQTGVNSVLNTLAPAAVAAQ